MDGFPGLPENVYEYVNQFDYAVWTPGTQVTACNVPWDASYRDVVSFGSAEDKAAWFQRAASSGADGFTLTGLTYLKFGEPVRLPVPFSQVNQCNYLVVRNPEQPIPSRVTGRPLRIPDTFYYFVTDVRYLAPNCTELTIQLDVWTTYADRLTFGRSFVARGHAGIANEASNINNIADYLTDLEGLDYGGEYEVVGQKMMALNDEPPMVVIMSTAKLTGGWGTVDNPTLATAQGSNVMGMYSGCEVYAVELNAFKPLMALLSNSPWVSQCITYMTLVPRFMLNLGGMVGVGPVGYEISVYQLSAENYGDRTWSVENVFGNFKMPERYASLYKLYSSPYCYLEVTALTGGELMLKPECLFTYNNRLDFTVRGAVSPPDVRLVVYPTYYNASSTVSILSQGYNGAGALVDYSLDSGENLDMGLVMSNFPQLSVVNNGYMAYLASTNYSRQYQFQSADWSRERALHNAKVARGQASQSMMAQERQTNIGNRLTEQSSQIALEQNALSGVTNILGGVATGLGGNQLGGAAQAVGAIVQTSANADWIARSTANQVAAANASTQASIQAQTYTADTNLGLASYNAMMDYKNTIAGIEAQVQDARLTQPSVAGQTGGDVFNWANGIFGVLVKWKRPKRNHLVQLGEWFLRYGYIVNRWIDLPADLALMDKFTYWEIQDPQVFADMPELFKQTVRGILSAGVTVWTSPDYIGRTDFADNRPKGGFSY